MATVDTGVLTSTKTRVFVSPTPYNVALDTQSDAAVLAAFEAITDWVEINEITTLGKFGGAREVITHTPINTGVTKKLPGTNNNGQLPMTMAYRPADPGQAILQQAAKSNESYVFKIVKNDGNRPGVVKPSMTFLNGIVLGYSLDINDANKIVGAEAPIEINDKLFRLPAETA